MVICIYIYMYTKWPIFWRFDPSNGRSPPWVLGPFKHIEFLILRHAIEAPRLHTVEVSVYRHVHTGCVQPTAANYATDSDTHLTACGKGEQFASGEPGRFEFPVEFPIKEHANGFAVLPCGNFNELTKNDNLYVDWESWYVNETHTWIKKHMKGSTSIFWFDLPSPHFTIFQNVPWIPLPGLLLKVPFSCRLIINTFNLKKQKTQHVSKHTPFLFFVLLFAATYSEHVVFE